MIRFATATNGHADLPRLPPQNLEAEQGVLGSMILDNAMVAPVRAILAPDDFYRDAHQVLCRAIYDLDDRAGAIDAITLIAELERLGLYDRVGGDLGLAAVMDSVPHPANAVYYARIVREKSRARAWVEVAQQILEDAHGNLMTVEDLQAAALRRIDVLDLRNPDRDRETFGYHSWPGPLEPAALFGLAGEVVRRIAPQTEADPAAILAQFLAGFGNVIGRKAHWLAEATRHALNLFVCVVGASSKARKGTSWAHVRRLLADCDPDWGRDRIRHGLSSAEGLAVALRDSGEIDRRLLIVESEFGSTLQVMSRDGNTLSGLLRQAWESDSVCVLTKHNPIAVSDAHLSLIAHITAEDLELRLSSTDAANGFGNRFLWVCARRAQLLPHGGLLRRSDFDDLRPRLTDAINFARQEELCLVRDQPARGDWEACYAGLTRAGPGILGAILSRAEAQVMRLACLYALLDQSVYVHREHLQAALALWRYCDRSAAHLFGSSSGEPELDTLLAALRNAGKQGLALRQIHALFGGHMPAQTRARLLARLEQRGLAHCEQRPTGGRPALVWFATLPEE